MSANRSEGQPWRREREQPEGDPLQRQLMVCGFTYFSVRLMKGWKPAPGHLPQTQNPGVDRGVLPIPRRPHREPSRDMTLGG